MLFDIVRASDVLAGRQGPDVLEAPTKGAVWNPEENRWEIKVDTLEQLLEIGLTNDNYLLIVPAGDDNDLPILQLQDQRIYEGVADESN